MEDRIPDSMGHCCLHYVMLFGPQIKTIILFFLSLDNELPTTLVPRVKNKISGILEKCIK